MLLVEKDLGFEASGDLPKLGYKGVESCELSFGGLADIGAKCNVIARQLVKRHGIGL